MNTQQNMKQFLAILLTAALLFVPSQAYGQKQQPIIPLPSNWCGTGHCTNDLRLPPPEPPPGEHLNMTLISHSQAQSVTVYNKITNHQITSADYASEATILSAMFDNWDKAGFTANLQALILNNPSLFLNPPTQDQLHKGWLNIAGTGLYATESDYDNMMLGPGQQERQELVNIVQTQGLQALHAALVQEFQNLSNGSKNQQFGRLVFAKCKVPWATIGGLYLGIAALMITGPVGVAVAVVAIASGGAGLLGGC